MYEMWYTYRNYFLINIGIIIYLDLLLFYYYFNPCISIIINCINDSKAWNLEWIIVFIDHITYMMTFNLSEWIFMSA